MPNVSKGKLNTPAFNPQAQGPWMDLALHTLGWKAFQDLAVQTCEEVLKMPLEIYREAQDGGQDAAFLARSQDGEKLAVPAAIQCKFSGKADANFNLTDLRPEEVNIENLKKEHGVDIYIIVTSKSVSGTVALAVKERLRTFGIQRPEIYGKEFLIANIRASARLRALVPRVYGLGDLSIILDQRAAAQTKALLGHLQPTLSVYVPTAPHITAVKILAKHHIVLLLGDPATGKSTIAALLATTAAEQVGRPCYKSDGPNQVLARWNPHDPVGFFWIDDAFGPNQPREDFIDTWITIMPHVQAAIAGGCQVVLTSRRHIYEAAKDKLGSRNHPLFQNEEAIVDVGVLSLPERKQILYNHVKAGNQPVHWKSRIKEQLESLAGEPSLLPEIARRLGDMAYTTNISTSNDSLLRFIREPKEHLIQTIKELSQLHRAALTLVFLHRGQMPVGDPAPGMQELVLKHYSVDAESLGQALDQLNNSFLSQVEGAGNLHWSFKHPTIADAISAILGGTSGLCELYLRGTKSQTIVAEAACAGAKGVRDAVAVPKALNDLLAERLAELPDEPGLNRRLFSFLNDRASGEFFELFVSRHGDTLSRETPVTYRIAYDPTPKVMARAHQLGLLPDELRYNIGLRLEEALVDYHDMSFLEDDDLLSLIFPSRLLQLPAQIRSKILANIPDLVESQVEDADLDYEPKLIFNELTSIYQSLEDLFAEDESAKELLSKASSAIDGGIKAVARMKKKREEEEEDEPEEEEDEWHWQSQTPAIPTNPPEDDTPKLTSARSIFSDVDE